MSDYKMLFLGASGSGKSTAIQTLTGSVFSKTEFRMVDYDSHVDSSPVFDLQFAGLPLGDGDDLYLFEFSRLPDSSRQIARLASRFLAVCLLINNGSPRPLDELSEGIDDLAELVGSGRLVVGITHMDRYATTSLQDYQNLVVGRGLAVPVLEVDPRDKKDVAMLAQTVIYSSISCGFEESEI